MAFNFKLTARLHAPLVMPAVPLRLDSLLTESLARLHNDWATPHSLPLVWDDTVGGYRASQLVFGVTADSPLCHQPVRRPSQNYSLDRTLVRDPRRVIPNNGGSARRRLTSYDGYLAPFVVCYGQAPSATEADTIPDLLALLDGIGVMHQSGFGAFTHDTVLRDDATGWRNRSWPAAFADRCPARRAVRAIESLVPRGPAVDVVRPRRIDREAV